MEENECVDRTHCCGVHGCKYGDDAYCLVARGEARGLKGAAWCQEPDVVDDPHVCQGGDFVDAERPAEEAAAPLQPDAAAVEDSWDELIERVAATDSWDELIERVAATVLRDAPPPPREVKVVDNHIETPRRGMTSTDRGFVLVLITVMLVLPWVLAKAAFHPGTPVVNVEQPVVEMQLDAQELAAQMTLPRFDRDPDTGQILGWPENTGQDEGEFIENCRDVCTHRDLPSIRRRGDPEPPPLPPSRMLYHDFEHLVCVCFGGRIVRRYVGWQRR